MQFHQAIVAAARIKALADTHATYNDRLWWVLFLASKRKAGQVETRLEHFKIIEYLQARDPSATAAALKRHLRTAENNIAAALDERARAAKEKLE